MTKRTGEDIRLPPTPNADVGVAARNDAKKVKILARDLSTEKAVMVEPLQQRKITVLSSGTFQESGGKISEVKVSHQGHTYTFNFSQSTHSYGGTKQLFAAHAYSVGAPPYLAVKVKPEDVDAIEQAAEMLTALHSTGLEGVDCLDDPPHLVTCTGPNGKECTIAIVKTKNKGDMEVYKSTEEFQNLQESQLLGIIKDLVKGQYLQDRVKLIQVDGKLKNILAHEDQGKIGIKYTDFDGAVLFRNDFYTDKQALARFIVHLEKLTWDLPYTYIPSLEHYENVKSNLKDFFNLSKNTSRRFVSA